MLRSIHNGPLVAELFCAANIRCGISLLIFRVFKLTVYLF